MPGCRFRSEIFVTLFFAAQSRRAPTPYEFAKPSVGLMRSPNSASAAGSSESFFSFRFFRMSSLRVPVYSGYTSISPLRSASKRMRVPPSSRRCTVFTLSPAFSASCRTISPRITDSVNFLEPTLSVWPEATPASTNNARRHLTATPPPSTPAAVR